MSGIEAESSMTNHHILLDDASEKALPEDILDDERSPPQIHLPDVSPRYKRRPSASSGHSSQRQRKRVTWKGKTCYIALPLDDERGKRPLLTPSDVIARMKQRGNGEWDGRSFILNSSPAVEDLGAQSCRLYPDPGDLRQERTGGQFRVSIPNQVEWDLYVNFLKEQRLRALGVTLNDDGHQGTTPSPFALSMSRGSLESPGQPLSPPAPYSSAAANSRPLNGPCFPPAFQASHPSSRVSSVTPPVPSYMPPQNIMDRPTKSSVYTAKDLRRTSPFHLHLLRQPPSLPRDFSPSTDSVHRQDRDELPSDANLQNLGRAPPVASLLKEINHNQPNGSFAQILQQPEPWPQSVSHQHANQSCTKTAAFDHGAAAPALSGNEWQIVHPAPQSHQRNISEALQKEIDAAEEAIRISHQRDQVHRTAPHLDAREPHGQPHSFLLQKGRHSRCANDFHHDGHLLSPSTAPGQVELSENGNTNASTAELSPNEFSQITDDAVPNPHNRRKDQSVQQANRSWTHRATSSTSKLNVKAEEFKYNPQCQFPSSHLVSTRDACQSSKSDDMPSFRERSSHGLMLPKSTIATRLNVDAPPFTPSAFGIGTMQSIQVTSNVKASWRASVSEKASGQSMDVEYDRAADKIFTNFVPDYSGKALRRGKVSKAMPIVQPDDEECTEDDEDGQVRVSTARQKRARVQNDCVDDTPQYATTGPLQEDGVHLFTFENAARSLCRVAGGNKDATRVSSAGVSPAIRPRREDQGLSTLDAHSTEDVRPLFEMQALSYQRDLHMTEDEKEVKTVPSPGQWTMAKDQQAENLGSTSHPSRHRPTVSLSELNQRHAVDDGSCDISPSTSKRDKLVLPKAASHAATSSSWSPAMDLGRTPLPPLSSSERSDLSLPLKPTEEGGREIESVHSHNNGIGTGGEGVSLEAFQSNDRYSGQPLDDLPPRSPDLAKDGGTVPSFDEIDAIMKQFRDNPDLGVERVESPPTQSRPAGVLFLNPSINIRGDTPSPCPGRIEMCPEAANARTSAGKARSQVPSNVSTKSQELSINRAGSAGDSGRNGAPLIPDDDEDHSRSQLLDIHVQRIVGAVLEERLGPLQTTLQSIEQSIVLMATQPHAKRRATSTSDNTMYSDADDEDEDTQTTAIATYRTGSPVNQRRDRKAEMIKTAVREALAAHNHESGLSGHMDQAAFKQLLDELRSLKDSPTLKQRPDEIRTVVDDVISTHPRLRGKRVREDHEAGVSQKFRLQIDGLESMLKVANERAEEDYRARRSVEDDLAETQRSLDFVAEEAAQYREAAEEAERSLQTYYAERESARKLKQSNSELSLKNAALETTLEQYRLSHDQWRTDIDEERQRNRELKAVLHALRGEIEETSQVKQGLRAKLERLQDDMADVMGKVGLDQALWNQKEHELSARNKEMESDLRQEKQLRQKLELQIDDLAREHKEFSEYRIAYEVSQKENTRLEALLAETRQENRTHEDAAHRLAREIDHLRTVAETEASEARATYEHQISLLQSQRHSVSANLEDQISRLQAQLRKTEEDAQEIRARHQVHLGEQLERHTRTLHEVNESKEAAIVEQRRSHEKALNDLRERHARVLHNSSDDRQRLEAHLMEKLTLSRDKIEHLEGKVNDLQQRLEISSSAAKAAAAAATGKGGSGSDAHLVLRSTGASMPLVIGNGIPEKISPQALRESIMVLQDQLQNREQTIELLEAELAEVDKDAPSKLKERETEVTWLRELLGVRIDDLEDIIDALSEAEYDREVVKDAVIRLKANLQMEQQEKERGPLSTSGVFPSIASLAQTPRALPMAAVAAWGNWRKARDTSQGAISGLRNTHEQTPTRSNTSPQSFLSGLLTPPRTSQRHVTPSLGSVPTTTIPLDGSRSFSEARPLGGHSSSQTGSVSARRPLGPQQSSLHAHPVEQQQQPGEQVGPSTPPSTKKVGYDGDTDARRSIMNDFDDDASPVGFSINGGESLLERPFEEVAR